MRALLPRLQQPSRYLGIEQGSVHKDPGSVSLHGALCFPDLYEVGMSYLGHKILYGIVNAKPAWWAERCFEPDAPASALLRGTGTRLTTLESGTELRRLAWLGFALTHEMCWTDLLNMLDLGGVPLRTADRPEDLHACPLVMAGGGAALTAEPLAPFLDCVLLGDGEESLPEVLTALETARAEGLARSALLLRLARVPGVYVPSLFAEDGDGLCRPLVPDLPRPTRRVVSDLESAPFPAGQAVPLATVHNRLALEIARGCTRGCRFCNAGYVYRPARERSVETCTAILNACLEETGFDEVGFLALSAGDYSALRHLCAATLDRCAGEQISLSLPSLRVGSIDDAIMERMSQLRRTGITLAPEAGSQRLRNVINKGITEEELITHVQKLIEYGWRQVKLYFMIGLPSETDEDLQAIVDLCRKVRLAGGPGRPKLAVTAAVSPFVPKPCTPFQWEDQISLPEIDRRVHFLLERFRKLRGLTLRWHEPGLSHLEGILSRAGRSMAPVVEKAFRKGAILACWKETFSLQPWLEALAECGLDPEACTRGRATDAVLPWDHIQCGVEKAYFLKERERAFQEKVTEDCRYHPCRGCGACDREGRASLLTGTPGKAIRNRLVYPERDQVPNQPARDEEGKLLVRSFPKLPPKVDPGLTRRSLSLRIWHEKLGAAAWISQLELQAVLDRALRRAGIPMAFSQGFHPLPLMSFGRALPVGLESRCEWFSLTLRRPMAQADLLRRLGACLPAGLRLYKAEPVAFKDRALLSEKERFALRLEGQEDRALNLFRDFLARSSFLWTWETRKGPRSADVRPLVERLSVGARQGRACLSFVCSWTAGYLSPFQICEAVLAPLWQESGEKPFLQIMKTAQHLPGARPEEGDSGTQSY